MEALTRVVPWTIQSTLTSPQWPAGYGIRVFFIASTSDIRWRFFSGTSVPYWNLMLSVEHESEGSGEDSGFIPQRLTVEFHFLATHQARRTLVGSQQPLVSSISAPRCSLTSVRHFIHSVSSLKKGMGLGQDDMPPHHQQTQARADCSAVAYWPPCLLK